MVNMFKDYMESQISSLMRREILTENNNLMRNKDISVSINNFSR